MTFILIVSSVTMVLAVHAGHKNDKQGVIKWMIWTIIGGLAFLGCQAWEWTHLITGDHLVLINNEVKESEIEEYHCENCKVPSFDA
jgi:cytochrome c oxidase subunit 3